MRETIGGYSFEAEGICPTPAPPHFKDGFGQRLRSIDANLPFNDWFKKHQALIRGYIHHWGLLVIDDVQVVYDPQSWHTMRVDPEFSYLPWHSDGSRGEQSLLLAHIHASAPRKAPTLVAPSCQIYFELRDLLVAAMDRFYPNTRTALQSVCEQDVGLLAFFEGVFLHFQHASIAEQSVFKQLFERGNNLAAPWVYRHQWRPNSVLLFDTANYDGFDNQRGFNRVVHGRMPIAGESLGGFQPYRWLI